MKALTRAFMTIARSILDVVGRVIGWVTPVAEAPAPAFDDFDVGQKEIAASENRQEQEKKPDPVSEIRHALAMIARRQPLPNQRLQGVSEPIRNQLKSMTRNHAKALLATSDEQIERWLSTSMPPSVEIKRRSRRPRQAVKQRHDLGLVPTPS